MQKITKKRFSFGKDANKMLERKLLKNFIMHGKLTSTEKKIKFIIPTIEKIISTAKKNTEASKNIINKKISDKKIVNIIINNIIPVFKERSSGFTKYYRLFNRISDGTTMARLEWTEPVVIEKKIKVKKVKKDENKNKKEKNIKKK